MSSTPELGLASSFRSVADMWHHRVGSTPDSPALHHLVDGVWRTLTWAEAGRRVRALANGLLALGLEPEDRCVIVAETCVDWILADLAITCAGCATTTVYPQTPDADLAYIVADSGARVVFTDHPNQAERLVAMRGELPELDAVIVFHGEGLDDDDDWVVALDRFERTGRDHGAMFPQAYERAHRSIRPGQMATLMYTSGTTGKPRGVVLSHDAWIYEAEAIDALGVLSPADVQLLWLPLAHVFAKVLQLIFVRLGIPTAVDGRAHALLPNLRMIRPTWMAAVPLTFERLRHAIEAEARGRGAVAWSMYRWALGVGRRAARARRVGPVPPALRVQWAAADRLVAHPIRERLGGRLRFVISGGAPLPAEVAEYFDALGVLILEGYGLTESAAASCVNRPRDPRFGTVGPPLPGCQVRVADDGEVQLASRGLMTQYWNDPARTRAAFTADGFLKTGDLGTLLPTGHLKITGRIKEVIVTSAGKNVAPLHMEEQLRGRTPLIEHVVLHGNGRPFCTALITLEPRAATRWARDRELAFADLADLRDHPKLVEAIQHEVDIVNRGVASFERIRGFAIVDGFTEANGLLTPSAKVRRAEVDTRYREVLDGLYASGGARAAAPAWRIFTPN